MQREVDYVFCRPHSRPISSLFCLSSRLDRFFGRIYGGVTLADRAAYVRVVVVQLVTSYAGADLSRTIKR